ncbi:hypothetical protein Goshw_023598 [Gossypium schwendimanii]|uniref:Uncharacterized protein n=1 Tax=Gossypium schwendimanii TaxID=34291 RepID=A0A7J9KUX5_GOSSC|nr:hypothetical protein [Gossypium schwendimanii]
MKSGYEQCYFCITENRIAAILLKEAAEPNRAVEVNEMWRVRQKEMELNDRLKSRSNDHSGNSRIVRILASLIEAEIGGMRAMLVLHAHQAKQ